MHDFFTDKSGGDHGNSHKKAKGDVLSKTDPMSYKTKGDKTDWRLMKQETKTRKDKRNTHKFGGKDNYDAFNQVSNLKKKYVIKVLKLVR